MLAVLPVLGPGQSVLVIFKNIILVFCFVFNILIKTDLKNMPFQKYVF